MHKPHFFYKVCLLFVIGIGAVLVSLLIKAAPQDAIVRAGEITITSNAPGGITTLITQTTPKGIIDWRTFSIGETERTHFAQPGVTAITLNRVTGGELSQILGQLTATGQILLLNPSGILFGPRAQVDVAGLIASTANITDENFLAQNYYFVQGPGGSDAKIVNRGYIKVADSGMVYLVAPGVENYGVIEANLGKVVLGSVSEGTAFTLDFYGDQLIQFALSSDVGTNIDTAIKQGGKILAPGGKVLLSAETARRVVDTAINMSGLIEASAITSRGGQVILAGGEKGVVSVTGRIAARGEAPGVKGGTVQITGEKVGLFDNAIIDVSGMAGGGEVLLGSTYLGEAIVPAAEYTYVAPAVSVLASAITQGSGGNIIVWSNQATGFYGLAEARGGVEGGEGGFFETSSLGWLGVSGIRVDLSAPQGAVGTWSLDPYDVTINTSASSGGDWSGSNPIVWAPFGPSGSTLYVEDILTNLNAANVEIMTGNPLKSGDILWEAGADLTYAGPDPRTLSLIAGNDITINAIITGSNLDLILSATSNIYLNTNIVGIHSFAAESAAIYINAPQISTYVAQTYNAPVFLGATNVVLFTNDVLGDITFANTISTTGNYGLVINAAGITTFGGEIGSGIPLSYLNVAAVGGIDIGAPSIVTVGGQAYTGAVRLMEDVAIAGENIIFASAIDSATGLFRGLGIDATGSVTFNAPIGAVEPLGYLDVVAAGGINIGATSIITTGNQIYTGPVRLTQDVSLMGEDIFFASAIDSATGLYKGLGIDATGNVIFSAPIGALSTLGYLNVAAGEEIGINADVTTRGAQTYVGSVVLGGTGSAMAFTTTNNDIVFVGDVSGIDQDILMSVGTGNIELPGVSYIGNLQLVSTGNITLGGNISNIGDLNISAGGITYINAPRIVTAEHQIYSSAIRLGANTLLIGNDIYYASTIDSDGAYRGMTIDASGNVTFLGAVGSGNALSYLTVDAAGGINLYGGHVITTGTQSYRDAVVLGADTTLETIGAGSVIFESTLSGDATLRGLTIDAAGNIRFDDIVGTLQFLNVAAGGITYIDVSGITTIGAQKYVGDVVLTSANPMITFTTSGNAITFADDITGAGQDVVLSSGPATISLGGVSDVGNLSLSGIGDKILGGIISNVESLNVAAGGLTYISAPSIMTIGDQNYYAPIMLLADTTLGTTTASGDIVFSSTIDGGYDLYVAAQGSTIFSGAVGSTVPLASLRTDTLGITYINGGSITTTGFQLYDEPVILGANTTLAGTNIGFAQTLESAVGVNAALNISAVGNVVFGEPVGSLEPLGSLNIAIPPSELYSTYLYGGVTTIGPQTYGEAVILKSGVTLTTSGSDIFFASTINGFYNFILNVGSTGNITFNGDIGTFAIDFSVPTGPLAAMQILNAHNVIGNAPIFVTAFIQSAGTGTTNLNLLYVFSPAQVEAGGYPGTYVKYGYGAGTALGTASFTTAGNVSAYVDVGTLVLDIGTTSQTFFTGYVHGSQDLSPYIIRINPIPFDTQFFNVRDLASLESGKIVPDTLQAILKSLMENFGFGFGYEFLGTGYSAFDYMLLLEETECEIEEI